VFIAAPDRGPGNWAGAPHAILDAGVYWLSYRLRRATRHDHAQTRGVETVVARSEDGEHQLLSSPHGGAPSEDRLAERARDELDGELCCRILAIEDRVHLDHLE
jgi:hypothetical protein